jgi:hypothetical protein
LRYVADSCGYESRLTGYAEMMSRARSDLCRQDSIPKTGVERVAGPDVVPAAVPAAELAVRVSSERGKDGQFKRDKEYTKCRLPFPLALTRSVNTA